MHLDGPSSLSWRRYGCTGQLRGLAASCCYWHIWRMRQVALLLLLRCIGHLHLLAVALATSSGSGSGGSDGSGGSSRCLSCLSSPRTQGPSSTHLVGGSGQ